MLRTPHAGWAVIGMAGSSDPVPPPPGSAAPLDPLLGIYAAVTRRTLDGKNPNGWVPGEKITVEEALRAYTNGNAYGMFAERNRGKLAAGYLADVVLLNRDLTAIPPPEIERVQVRATVAGGRLVFQR